MFLPATIKSVTHVNNRSSVRRLRLPLLGTNRTFRYVRSLVAIGGKADVTRTARFGRE
jgi:hypothetical protein